MEGRTYRYFKGEPLFPFGYGLSYTSFHYGKLNVPAGVKSGAEMKVSVEVKNSGKRAGDEVVELYVKREVRSLAGFERVSLKPGEKRMVEFTLSPHQLGTGTVEISAGGDSAKQAVLATSKIQ
jgi:beta-glucosidase